MEGLVEKSTHWITVLYVNYVLFIKEFSSPFLYTSGTCILVSEVTLSVCAHYHEDKSWLLFLICLFWWPHNEFIVTLYFLQKKCGSLMFLITSPLLLFVSVALK